MSAHHPGTAFSAAALNEADIERWRNNIRADTFGHYHYEMGVALEREGSHAAAAAAFERCITILPDKLDAYARLDAILTTMGDVPAAVALRTRARTRYPDYDVASAYQLALDVCRRNDFRQAVALCRQNLAVHPSHAPTLMLLGIALIRQGHLAEGFAAFETDSITLIRAGNTELAELALEAGTALYHGGRSAEAVRLLDVAVQLDLDNTQIWYVLALASRSILAIGKAADAMERACTLNPYDTKLQEDRADTMQIAVRPEQATDAAQRALNAGATAARHALLGRALHLAQDYAQAVISFRAALSMSDNQPVTLAYCGLSLCALGQPEKGLEALLQARGMAREAEWAYLFLTFGLLAAGRSDASAAVARRAVALAPDGAWHHLALAATLAASVPPAAQSACRRAVALRAPMLPYYTAMVPWAREALSRLFEEIGAPWALTVNNATTCT